MDILARVPSRDSRILLLGTGLTAAEAALTLVSRGHGKIVALSPSDLLPEHAPRETE